MTDIQFIPAPAGYYGLWLIEQAPGYGRSIITGYQLDTPHGHASWVHAFMEGENPYDIAAILCPDGTVNQTDSGKFWPDVNSWLAEMREERKLSA